MLSQREIMERASQLSSLPPSCLRLAALAAQEAPDLKEIEKIISLDPILTAKVLRLANSVMFAPSRRIGSVRDAVVRTGTQALLGVLVGHSTGPLMKKHLPSLGYSSETLWGHSVATAIATKAIEDRRPQFSSVFSFTSGLLHDIGKLVLEPLMTPARVSAFDKAITEGGKAGYEAEYDILAMNHAEVSGVIIQLWLLPEIIAKAVTLHHYPGANVDSGILVVYMANVAANQISGRPLTPAQLEIFNAISAQVGITPGEF